MSHYLTVFARLSVFAFTLFYVALSHTPAQIVHSFAPTDAAPPAIDRPANNFVNPLLKSPGGACAADNLRAERFAPQLIFAERVRLCHALESVTNKLNSTAWSPALLAELRGIWRVFSTEVVTLRPMPADAPAQALAMAEPFPDKTRADIFAAAVYVRADKSGAAAFFQILLHELRHVLDFHETWRDKTALPSLEAERRAYRLMGKVTRETPEREKFSGVPKFWKESWRKFSEDEIAARREAAIGKYLRGKKLYRELERDPARRTLDFSHLKTTAATTTAAATMTAAEMATTTKVPIADPPTVAVAFDKNGGERLPAHRALPPTAALLAQNVREAGFNLEKPQNPRDPKEILRVAINNEKRLYYGMSNFVYDQKLAFQCLKSGRVAAAFAENTTVARAADGNALFTLPAAPAALPCILNYPDLRTDFTNTFWASPALEKMPVYFSGFQKIENQTLAAYTVLQPDARLFAELEKEYQHIRPFRVVVGTIYVSPEDGQIVRFAGTSYPEETVTGDYARTVRCTYYVKAVRQKLDIEGGLWVTVHVGTVAVASVRGKIHPFNYTVKFENYRQSETDVKILDDDAAVAVNAVR